jgi:hypothetical protein
VDCCNSSDANGQHQREEDDLGKEHKAKCIIEKLLQPIDTHPCQIYPCNSENPHTRETQNPLRFGDPSPELPRPYEYVNIEYGPEKDSCRQEMEIPNYKSKDPVERGFE